MRNDRIGITTRAKILIEIDSTAAVTELYLVSRCCDEKLIMKEKRDGRQGRAIGRTYGTVRRDAIPTLIQS